jgi:uncharacterized membrane protein YcaP (DUF421 family)
MNDWDAGVLAAAAVRTAIVFALLVVGIRLTGKRQTGEMNAHDLLVVLIVANAVQNSMTKGNGSLVVALVSSGTLILLGWLLAFTLSRRPDWQAGLVGEPTVIVEDGRMIHPNMRREGVTKDDLMAAVRDQGVAAVANVKLAVLEVDGTISVVPRERAGGG